MPKIPRKSVHTTRVTRQSPIAPKVHLPATSIYLPVKRTKKQEKRKERSCRLQKALFNQEDTGLFRYSVEERLFDPIFDEILGKSFVTSLTPDDFTLDRLLSEGLTSPLVFRERNPHGMRIPSDLTVDKVAKAVGENAKVEVLDCATQEGIQMTMGEFVKYYTKDKKDEPLRKLQKIYNLIDLEVSHTSLSDLIDAPALVRAIDWATNLWPVKPNFSRSPDGKEKYPKTQKYVLLSKAGCYTDFHIDFGGSSVWYRIVRGKKVFLLIRPTEKHRQIYAQWVISGQNSQFLGDLVDECERVVLGVGQTLIIPSGWIHAVYTLEDSVVIGGNFLHSFSGEMQLDVAVLEDTLRVEKKIRYPFLHDLLWLVVQRYAAVWAFCKNPVNRFELASLKAIFAALKTTLGAQTKPYCPVADEYVKNQAGLLKTFEKTLATLLVNSSECSVTSVFSMNLSMKSPSRSATLSSDSQELSGLCKESARTVATQTDIVPCSCSCRCHAR